MKYFLFFVSAFFVLYFSFSIVHAAPAPVPQTGQTTSYAAGDDGQLETGVTWPVPRFTDNVNGTVTDNLTGLIWLKNAKCFGTKIWTDALAAANSLASGSCGLTDGSKASDWHLPTIRELRGLGNVSLISQGYYPGSYWSSSTCASNTGYAWVYNGNVHCYDKAGGNYYVFPVRSGQ